MADSAEPLTHRYSAFISYSHADAKAVRKLHRQLETYRLPVQLAGPKGHGARRLKPVFRDSDEMSAAHDLTEAIREALAQADYLIVICSPDAAKSQWVGREIEVFRALHGDRRILAALMSGDPETSFPPALRHGAHDSAIQPLAADFRPGASGGRMAMLRLVAPMAGVHLDDLVHRDAQRRMRRILVGAACAVAAITVVAAMALVTLNARSEATVQRSRASGLGEFMITDLRKGLKAAGQSDLLAEVDRAALQAYPGENLSRLGPEQLEGRAKAQHAMGEDSEKRGDLPTARAQFEAAWRATAALLTAKPDDPKRIFTHAQSEYWVGFINWREGKGNEAKAHFEAYTMLAARLVAIDPSNDDWVMETVYAEKNLGMLALRQSGDTMVAVKQFEAAIKSLAILAKHKPKDRGVMDELEDADAWLADSQRLQGNLNGARASREAQRQILQSLMMKAQRDIELKGRMLRYDLAIARIELAQGAFERAVEDLRAGQRQAQALAQSDPENADHAKQARMFELFLVRTWLDMPSRTRPPIGVLNSTLGDCHSTARGFNNDELSDFCAILSARIFALTGDESSAQAALAIPLRHAAARHDILTAHWGLNITEEAKLVGKAK